MPGDKIMSKAERVGLTFIAVVLLSVSGLCGYNVGYLVADLVTSSFHSGPK